MPGMQEFTEEPHEPRAELQELLAAAPAGKFADRRERILHLLDAIAEQDGPEAALIALHGTRRVMTVDQTYQRAATLRFTIWYREIDVSRLVALAPPNRVTAALEESARRGPAAFMAIADELAHHAATHHQWVVGVQVFLARQKFERRPVPEFIRAATELQRMVPEHQYEARNVLARGMSDVLVGFTPDRPTLDQVIAIVTDGTEARRTIPRALAELHLMGGRMAQRARDADAVVHYLAPLAQRGEQAVRIVATGILASALIEAERFAEALEYLAPTSIDQARDPSAIRHLRELRGLALYGDGREPEALQTLRRAYGAVTILDTVDISALSVYALLELQAGNPDRADWAAARARAERPLTPMNGPGPAPVR